MARLFVVATPIGNLEDVTLRALRVLGEVDQVFAEDTRRTRVLLDRHGISARLRSLNAHNESERTAEVIGALRAGRSVAVVSDAGTPLVSDPGERLVAAVVEAGGEVEALPGPSAVLTALAVSGLPAQPFVFAGFPPRKEGARRRWLASWAGRPETLILFESPNRVARTLQALAELLGERRACVARELTKLHEEVVRGNLSELADRFSEGARGEITIVVEGAGEESAALQGEAAIERRARALCADGASARDAADALARESGLPRRECYARIVAIRSETGAEDSA